MSENTNRIDEKLLEDLRSDSSEAFDSIFREWYTPLFCFAKEYVIDQEVAKNLVQDTFLSLWEKRKDLSIDTNFQSLLYVITRNNCLNYLRKLKSISFYEKKVKQNYQSYQFNNEALSKLCVNDIDFNEIQTIINRTIVELPPQCQTAFKYSRIEGLNNKEIATKMQISDKTVSAHIARALRSLRTALKDYLPFWLFL